MAEVEDLIGTAEAARILGVSSREVRRKAAEGVLPAEAVQGPGGREWRFRRSEVETYQRDRDQRAADGGRKALSVRPATAILAAQDRATAAAEQLAEQMAALADLPEVLRDNTDAIRALIAELRLARETIDEVQAERRPGWWARLIGR